MAHADGSSEVNYAGLIVPVVKAIQELKADNDNLVSKTAALEAQLKTANDNYVELKREVE